MQSFGRCNVLNWCFVECSWERELSQALQKVDQTNCELDEKGEKVISELSLCEWSKTNRTSRSMTEKNYCRKSSTQSVPRQNLSEIWLETQFRDVRWILKLVEVRLRESWSQLNHRSFSTRKYRHSDSETKWDSTQSKRALSPRAAMKSHAKFVERVGVLKDLGVITCCLALTFLVIENYDFIST